MQAIQRGSQFFNHTHPDTLPSTLHHHHLLLLDSFDFFEKEARQQRKRAGWCWWWRKEGDQMCWFCSDKDEKRMMAPFFPVGSMETVKSMRDT